MSDCQSVEGEKPDGEGGVVGVAAAAAAVLSIFYVTKILLVLLSDVLELKTNYKDKAKYCMIITYGNKNLQV